MKRSLFALGILTLSFPALAQSWTITPLHGPRGGYSLRNNSAPINQSPALLQPSINRRNWSLQPPSSFGQLPQNPLYINENPHGSFIAQTPSSPYGR